MNKKRTVIIGLDGAPYRLIDDLSTSGVMPNINMLMNNGVARQMASSIPEISSVAWSSIITGTDPGEHGIYGFIDLEPGTYQTVFPNYTSLKAQPFWHHDETKRSVIINVPSTYPARELNGVLIAGFVALGLDKATYPQSLVPRLKDIDYRIDINFDRAHESNEYFMNDLNKTLQSRAAAYRYLWDSEDWDIFMLVFTGTDRLMHFLWNAYENNDHPYHLGFLDHFRQIDSIIGEIVEKLHNNDLLIILSDHGFERIDKDINVNALLKQEGFLKFGSDSPSSLEEIISGTTAFALDPGRIYLNLRGKFPLGDTSPQDQDALLNELEEMLTSIEYNNKKVIKRCFRKEEIYHGPLLPHAPDLVLIGNDGFNLRGGIIANNMIADSTLAGKHTQSDAFLMVYGDSVRILVPEAPKVTDIVGIMSRFEERLS